MTNAYLYDANGATDLVNQAKEPFLAALEIEGLLTKPAAEVGALYAIVIHEPTFFGKLWATISGAGKSNDWKISIVKRVLPNILTQKE